MTDSNSRSYIAFISYRHKDPDRKAAIAVQRMIEHFRLPEPYRKRSGRDTLGTVFRDEDELPASSSLNDSIRYALDHSEFLIVICSPDLPRSKWCEEEIRYFLQTHDRDHLLAVLVSGDPQESFSPLMLHIYDEHGEVIGDVEPIAANIAGTPEKYNKKAFTKEITRLCAALIGCPFDELWQRERRYRARRRAVLSAIVFSAITAFAVIVGLKNIRIRAQNEEINAKNQEITLQNTELQIKEGKLLVEAGRLMLDENDRTGAAEKAFQALQNADIHTDGAELLLNDSVDRYAVEDLRLDLEASQDSRIDMCVQSSDGLVTITADQYGMIRAFRNREIIWTFRAVPSEFSKEYMDNSYTSRIYLTCDDKQIIVGNPYITACISSEDGALIWENTNLEAIDFFAVSDDGTKYAVFNDVARDYISIRSTADGSKIAGFYLPDMGSSYFSHYDFSTYSLGRNFGGNFSSDGRYFMFSACIRSYGNDELSDPDRKDLLVYCVIDVSEGKAWMAGKEQICFGLNPVFGLCYIPESDSLFFARHDDAARSTFAGIFDNEGQLSYILQMQDIKLNSTSVPWEYAEGNTTLAVSSADNLYLFSKTGLDYTGRYELGRNIIHLSWIDIMHDILFAIQEDGTYHVYPLSEQYADTVYMINGNLGINNIRNASVSGNGLFTWDSVNENTSAGTGLVHIVSNDSPEKCIAAQIYTDPYAEEILKDTEKDYLTQLIRTEDGAGLYLLQNDLSGKLIISKLDGNSYEITRTNIFDSVSYYTGNPIEIISDGEEVIYNGKLYKAGNHKELFEYADEFDVSLSKTNADMSQMADGKVLTAFINRVGTDADQLYVWIDSKTVCTLSASSGSSFHIDGSYGSWKRGVHTLLKTGCNGIVISGVRKEDDSSFSGYVLIDRNGHSLQIPSSAPSMPWSLICTAFNEPLFAVLEEDNKLRVYDASKGAAVLSISDDDDFSGAVDIAFSSDDTIIGVLSYNGTIKLYDAVNGELLLQESSEQLSTEYGTVSLKISVSSDGSYLIVHAVETTQHASGNALVFRNETFEHCATISNIAAFDAVNDSLLLFEDSFAVRRFFQCPLYRIETDDLFRRPPHTD